MKNPINQLTKHDNLIRKKTKKINLLKKKRIKKEKEINKTMNFNYKQSQRSYSLGVLWAIALAASYVLNHGQATLRMPSIGL